MNTYKIVLIEQIRVIWEVEAESEEQALKKAQKGDGHFIDGMMLGNPNDYFELEVIKRA